MTKKKAIIITGASSGLGKYLSEQLHSKYEIIACSRSIENVSDFTTYRLDVSDLNSLSQFILWLRQNKTNVYGLINNAALGAFNQVLTTPIYKVKQVMDVNYIGAVYLMQAISKMMIAQKTGRIINIGSQTLALKTPFEAAYASSKAAVETFSKIFAKEVANLGVTVNMVSPAVMSTKLIKGIPQERIDYMLQQQAYNKTVEFSDVLNVVEFLLNSNSHNITGQNIYLGGIIQ